MFESLPFQMKALGVFAAFALTMSAASEVIVLVQRGVKRIKRIRW